MLKEACAQSKQMSADRFIEDRTTPWAIHGSTTGLAGQNYTVHRGALELEAFHGSLTLLEDVLLLAKIHLWGDAAVLLFCPEVVLNQIKSLLIDFLVLVALQELYFIQAYNGENKTAQN